MLTLEARSIDGRQVAGFRQLEAAKAAMVRRSLSLLLSLFSKLVCDWLESKRASIDNSPRDVEEDAWFNLDSNWSSQQWISNVFDLVHSQGIDFDAFLI